MDQFVTDVNTTDNTEISPIAYAVETPRGEHPLLQSKRLSPAVNTMTVVTFRNNGTFAECSLTGIQHNTCVDTRPRDIKATCIISSDMDGCVQQEAWRWPVNDAIVISYVHVYKHTCTECLGNTLPL